MFKFDVLWMYSDYCYYDEDEIPRLRDNAPMEIKDSYEHYKEQKWKLLERDKVKKRKMLLKLVVKWIKERYGNKDVKLRR